MQGFNMGRYIPPASEDPALATGKVGGFNSQKGHPLGSRFSKAKDGLITVRFEMPFDVWCETCKPEFLIKQGVRFNAEKKKVGKYLSSPIWEFKFRHPPCSAFIGIKTDPENTQYIVSLGGRKKAGAPTTALDKDYGEILSEAERERRRNDAFAHLEGQNEDKVQEKTESAKLKTLYQAQNQHWEDPYTANQRLRRDFRAGRDKRDAIAQEKEEIQERYGLGIELLDHTQEDADRAALVEFGLAEDSLQQALARPVFKPQGTASSTPPRPSSMTKTEWEQQQATKSFQRNIVSNTKARLNPFGDRPPEWSVNSKKLKSNSDAQTDNSLSQDLVLKARESPASKCKLVMYEESDEDASN